MSTEVAHYVVTAHPPGGVLLTAKCNFLGPTTTDLIVAKSRRLEIRQPASGTQETSALPLVLSVPINGRLTAMVPLKIPQSSTSYLFLLNDKLRYAVISYQPGGHGAYPFQTHASGSFRSTDEFSLLGSEAESAPLVSAEPFGRCIALHLYEGLISILPVHLGYSAATAAPIKGASLPRKRPLLGEPYHLRMEERQVLSIAFLQTPSESSPQLGLLHRDSRGLQHVTVHGMNLAQKTNWLVGWKKSRIDGGSAKLICIPPLSSSAAVAAAAASTASTVNSSSTGGILILGQRQITYVQPGTTKVVPIPPCLLLTYAELPPSEHGPRYLLGDDLGNLHMLSVMIQSGKVVSLDIDTLGSTHVLTSSMTYLDPGQVFLGSQLGDSQLIQIHPEGKDDYISLVEEYTSLGPIVDMDWIPTHNASVVTASGSSIAGSLRVVRNGIGMKEYAGVEIPGIQDMWSLRASYGKKEDMYLVQSFVGETRVLGVGQNGGGAGSMDVEEEEGMEEGATLEEVLLSGLDSTSSTLFVGNVEVGDTVLQITETEVRLLEAESFQCITTWTPDANDLIPDAGRTITVASANEAGQTIVALRGGLLVYLKVTTGKELVIVEKRQMDKEVSCLDLNPFSQSSLSMEVEGARSSAIVSKLVAVGLWDDFTVRLLSLEDSFTESLSIYLSTEEDEDAEEFDTIGRSPVRRSRNNMMARSLCLVTLDSSSSSSSSFNTSSSSATPSVGVNMLFVGLGDGTVISFVVVQQGGSFTVQSKKEVSLGTQRINLIPLQTDLGGTCILATGDRPTVIYLAGGLNSNSITPKLCYSNVNLSSSEVEEEDMSRPPAQQTIAVNVATPFHSPELFDDSSLGNKHYSLCVSDDSVLRLGVIDDIQKLHVTTCRLGMSPRRVVHCPEGRLFSVGCIESGIRAPGSSDDEPSMGNCVRFLDDTTFDDIERIPLEPHELVLSMVHAHLTIDGDNISTEDAKTEGLKSPNQKSKTAAPYLLVGTAYALADEDEPTTGRILVFSCEDNNTNARVVRQVTELHVKGGVYSMCQFYDGMVLVSVNSKTLICKLSSESGGSVRLGFVGIGHHGHMLSLYLDCKAPKLLPQPEEENEASASASLMDSETPVKKRPPKPEDKEQLVVVGDLMRSISLIRYYPEHEALEEIARDFNANWTTAVEMLNDGLFLGAENWNNLFVLRRNAKATSEEVRCRLDTVGEYHLGEMANKFVNGSLVMPHANNGSGAAAKRPGNSNGGGASRRTSTVSPMKSSRGGEKAASRTRRPPVTIGSQTLYGTVDGTLGSILGVDARTAAFFATLERCMAKTIRPVGDFSHPEFRTFDADGRVHPAHGFIDGDLVESFLDLDRGTMDAVVVAMNKDGGWEIETHNKGKGGDDDDDDADMPVDAADSTLVVEDVLTMVEEMAMYH